MTIGQKRAVLALMLSALGVLLTGHNTATQKLMLYNRQKGELSLSSICLRGGDSSIFRINVDGMAGTDFINPDCLTVVNGAKVEASLASCKPEDRFQFLRVGYFCADNKDSSPDHLVFNRAVSLKDSYKPGSN